MTNIAIRHVKVVYLLLAIIAMLFTFLRLWLRARKANLWWDDALAFLAAISAGLNAAAAWMHFDSERLHSRTTKIAVYYMLSLCFYGALWPARLSILYTVIRINPYPAVRRCLHGVAAGMVVMWAILFAQIFWVCAPMPHWTSLPEPQCPLTRQVGILQLVSDILADGILIAVPLRFILASRLDTRTKARLVIAFGSSILTTIVSLVHTYYLLKFGGVRVIIAASVEIAVSVIVCNLSVVVTSLGQQCCNSRRFGEESDVDSAQISFVTWKPRRRRRHDAARTTTTFDLTTITVRKDTETYSETGGSELGKGRHGSADNEEQEQQKADLPGAQ